MAKKYSEVFGMDKDRKKLDKNDGSFWIFRIAIVKGKKLYDKREDTDDGKTLIKKEPLDIVHFDVHTGDENGFDKDSLVKFYSTNQPIIDACKDMLKGFGIANPTKEQKEEGIPLKEEFFVTVQEKQGTKQPYLCFV
jgi:hypothetical protein